MRGPSLPHRQAVAPSLDKRRKEEWKIFALLLGKDTPEGGIPLTALEREGTITKEGCVNNLTPCRLCS